MTPPRRVVVCALAAFLPPFALLGRKRRLALGALATWIAGVAVFWTLWAGPGAILVVVAMVLAPFAV